MKPLGTRAHAEELARLLEGAVAGPRSTTAPYATLAIRLRAVAPVFDDPCTPTADFRGALRQRLLAVATVQGLSTAAQAATPAPSTALAAVSAWSRTWRAQQRLALTAGAMAAVVGLTGVGIASSRSLPGEPFYGLKRVAEGVQLDLAGNDTARGTKHLEFAATRLREVRALAAGDTELALAPAGTPSAGGLAFGGSLAGRITRTLHDFDTEATRGQVLLQDVYRRTGRTAPLRILASFSTQQQARLSSLIPGLPAGTANAAEESLDLITRVGVSAGELLAIGTCTQACDPGTGGPTLTGQPVPTPGTSAAPSQGPGDNNGVPPCTCGQPTPSPTPDPSAGPTGEPTAGPTTEPSPRTSGSPSPTASPSPPALLPSLLPTPLPTITPLLPLPLPLPTILPTLAPLAVKP